MLIEEPDFTEEEKSDMSYWGLTENDIGRCSNCHRTVYIGLDECRYCGEVFTTSSEKESSELCDICANDLLWDSDSEEWYCPMSHSVFDL